MKNKLLITTALVAIISANNAYADDKYAEYKDGEVISADNLGHTSGDTRISFVGDDSTVTIKNDITLGNFTTLDGKTKLISDNGTTKKVTINGYLTQTKEDSDVSDVDLKIKKGAVTNSAAHPVTEGELVLGNNLKVGNIEMTDGTGIWLNTNSAEHKLDIAKDKDITFVDNNYIKGKDGASLSFAGDGGIINEGSLTLGSNVKIGENVIFKNAGTLENNAAYTGNLLMSGGKLTGTGTVKGDLTVKGKDNVFSGSDISGETASFDGATATYSGSNKLEMEVIDIKNSTLSGLENLKVKTAELNLYGTNVLNVAGGDFTLNNGTINLNDGKTSLTDGEDKGTLIVKDTFNNKGTLIGNLLMSDGKLTGTGTVNGDLKVEGEDNVFSGSDISGKTASFDGAKATYSGINKLDMDAINIKNSTLRELENLKVKTDVLNLSGANSLDVADGNFTLNKGTINLTDGTTSLTDGTTNKGTLIVKDKFNNHGTLDANAIFANDSTLIVGIDKDGGGKITGDINTNNANLKTIFALDTQEKSHVIASGTVTGDWNFDTNGNRLYNQKLAADNKTINFSKKSTGEIASSTGANNNQAGAVSAVLNGTSKNQSFNNVANNINNLLQSSNPSEVAAGLKMVDQMSADTSSSAQTTTSQTATQVFNAVGTRLSGGSVAGAMQGKSSGDSSLDNGAVWAQGLVSKAELDGANGFDADTNGIAFGAEKQITDTTKAGIGYAYSKTDIDSASRKTDVDTHTAIAYGEYKPSNWFVNGIATYGWGSYDESNAVKKASYDVDSFGLQAMTGYDIETNGMMLTPETGLRYVNIKQKAYTDSLGSKIGANSSDILTGVAGLKVSKEFTMNNGMTLKPEARAALTYDLSNDDANSVVTLANGSSYSTNGEALDKFGQEVGLGLTAGINENVDVSLGYEGRFRTDYTDHSGLLNAKYKF